MEWRRFVTYLWNDPRILSCRETVRSDTAKEQLRNVEDFVDEIANWLKNENGKYTIQREELI